MYEKQKRWLAKDGNREKHAAACRRCRERPEARSIHRKRQNRYASLHREQEKLRSKIWRKNNPERYRELQANYRALIRAGRNGVHLPVGFRKSLFLLQSGHCNACCASLVITGYHMDHIVAIAKGGLHVPSNLQLLCPTCNLRKSDKDFNDFLIEMSVESAECK